MIDSLSNPETQNYLEEVQISLDRLGDLENEMVRENKRLKRATIDMNDTKKLCESMMSQLKEQKMEINEKETQILQMERRNQEMRNERCAEELKKIEDEALKTTAKDILDEHENCYLKDGRFVCETCEDGWEKVPTLNKQPQCTFALHRNSKQKMND